MSKAADVKGFAEELRPHIEAALDSAEILKGLAAAAREKGIDWSALKALVKAQALDARDGTDKRVAAIIEKADFAASYADMLGFASNMNNKSESRSSSVSIAAGTAAPAQKPVQQEPVVQAISTSAPSQTHQQLQASVAIARSGGDPFAELEIPARLDRRVRQ